MTNKSVTQPLWEPTSEQIEHSQIYGLHQKIFGDSNSTNKSGVALYQALHEYSVKNKADFWSAVWQNCEMVGDMGNVVLADEDVMPGATWFPQASLNFAENLLKYRDDRVAMVSRLENGSRQSITYKALYQRVTTLATWMRGEGVVTGDRVAALMPNVIETVVTMLATASIGATFSSCSPDFGASGVLDRFGQIDPKLLIACDSYFYNGKVQDVRPRLLEITEQVSSIKKLVVVNIAGELAPNDDFDAMFSAERAIRFEAAAVTPEGEFEFTRLGFAQPLYIMYSSGTTGTPKCIVHSAGGTLIQHLKEHQYHLDLRRDDHLFYFTTCGWMMWNWLVSGLATGASLILYDGSPFYPNASAMVDLIDEEDISIFGTSAKYIAAIEKENLQPMKTHSFSRLRTVLSTGSPLSHESFHYIYRDFKADVNLASISGGTDILSCFVLGNPILPVYAGELQCAGLGMDVNIYDDDAKPLVAEKGELVCASPFPSMPIGFWQDEDGSKYFEAYFSRFDQTWAQGDYGEITVNGGYVIHGRSDAVLNPGGVRIGTAEIYRQVQKVTAVVDSVCVGQTFDDDVRVILFVVMAEGHDLDDALRAEIRSTIRANTTPRHVPAEILAVPDIPRTISGKIVELAVRNVIHGEAVKNTDALANPEALEAFKNLL